ncbi:TPA: hypothetical protein ACSPZY_002228 [Aeromonas veronii]
MMAKAFSEQAERSIIEAPHCRVAVYPAVRGWMSARVQIEFANTADGLGVETTPGRGGGHYLVEGATAEEVAKAASKLRGKPVEVVHVE